MKKASLVFGILIILSTIRPTSPILAQEAYLSDVVVTNTRDHLQVYFKVNDCFTEEMVKAIDSGIVTTFTFFVKLYEKRNFWLDKNFTDLELKHSIKYNSLKSHYEVKLSEQGNKVITIKDFEEAKKLMAEVTALTITPLERLVKNSQYQIQMMAQLDTIELPFYLHNILFFLSLWDFETDWYTIDFRY